MKSQQIRSTFLDFFKEKGHQIVPSAPMVVKDDPTLMFTNAGMNQFKEYFLDNAVPKHTKVSDSQKCLRVSGKHNDLEEVGYDTYHHTMFEMLGNWSFGDYFKKQAITWAWELLTEVYGIDKDMLYVSIFEGDASEGLEKDQEAYAIWESIIDKDRIILGNKKDNFWEMGDQGPCGPCSEIHVDIRSAAEKAAVPGKDLVNQDHPQVVEIWNLVFMQFNRKADGSLEELPAKHVDTGMGFERLAMVLQGVTSNYDTDVFQPLIQQIEKITGKKNISDTDKSSIAIRVIADHVRAVAFSIADGQLPSNTGAGYVIRRILRRAIRYGFTFLDQKQAFIHGLVATLVAQMGEAFPELASQKTLIENVIREEENSFLRTLEQGLTLLDTIIKEEPTNSIAAEKVFELKDTYGFPEDLTDLILRENGKTYSKEAFKKALQAQQDRARKATAITTQDWEQVHPDAATTFIGYDALTSSSTILRYRKVESKKQGVLYQLVLDTTPFYAESGGQVGDTGYLEDTTGARISIIDTKKENNLIVHFTKKLPANVQDTFKAVVAKENRLSIAANHSATHLLHQALREVLGDHVAQKGSMVHSEYLRFDFSHFSKVTPEQLAQIADLVNQRIAQNIPLQEQRDIAFDTAVAQGALALFGEKYADKVRCIGFGDSKELCGGTHVSSTAAIWHFVIKTESAVASGIRRIEAITGTAAKAYLQKQAADMQAVQLALKNPKDTIKAITTLQEENMALKKQIEQFVKQKAMQLATDLQGQLQEKNGVCFLAKEIDLDAAAIKDLCFSLGKNKTNLFLLFVAQAKGKVLLNCYISKELVASNNYNAAQVVRELGKLVQGGGGGQAFFATAGGKNPAGIAEVLEKAITYIQ